MDRFSDEVLVGDHSWGYSGDLSELQVAQEILGLDKQAQIPVLLAAIQELAAASGGGTWDRHRHARHSALKTLCSRLLRSNRSYSDQDIVWLLDQSVRAPTYSWQYPMSGVMRTVERYCRQHDLSSNVTASLNRMLRESEKRLAVNHTQEVEKLVSRIQALLSKDKKAGSQLMVESSWARQVRVDVEGTKTTSVAAWQELLAHARHSANKSVPAKAWSKQAREMLAEMGENTFLDQLASWLETYPLDPVSPEPNGDILKGLVWCAGLTGKEESAQTLGDFCQNCFTKVPDYGAKSVKLGNACLWALGQLDGRAGISQLCTLLRRVRYPSARKQIEKVLDGAADRAGLDRADLEEIGVPDLGLNRDGTRRIAVDSYHAELAITGTDTVSVTWITPDDKRQKSIPSAIKDSHAEDIKAVRKLAKDIRGTLSGQAARIERTLLTEREWDYPTWRARYADHPLLAHLTRRLVWQVEDAEKSAPVLAVPDGVEDITGRRFEPTNSARISLWHPINFSVETVLAWRKRLAELEISQPFKQAYREIYLLTDAERETGTYSNRFAAHIIRQHMFHAICQQRGWKYTLQGEWDSHNFPTRVLADLDTKVEFWVDPCADSTLGHSGVYALVTTDQVRFCDMDRTPCRLEDLSPLLFSEMMRDVDLFVSVCSVGNDPTWEDGGPEGRYREYWHEYSFGALSESAKTRHTVLERLLPRLKIAGQCHLEEKFLIVRGTFNSYKIHLGSGNILMEPGSRYLCIVPGRGNPSTKSKIWLPFEGDPLLTIILSKAFMLADDTKITDKTILGQINT